MARVSHHFSNFVVLTQLVSVNSFMCSFVSACLITHLSLFCIIERSYFMLDTDTDLVHFFRKSSDSKPYQSLTLNGGEISDDVDSDIIDE